ncbi:MAG: RibD family protein [Spirochaetia bacterium]
MNKPFVTVSYAQTIDGRTATLTEESQWISGEASLNLAHTLRRDNDAVAVGIGTVLADNPLLTCRITDPPSSPLRVIYDSELRIPLDSELISTAGEYPLCVITKEKYDPEKASVLTRFGAKLIPVKKRGKGLSVTDSLDALVSQGVRSVYVEGGAGLITSFLKERLVDRMIIVTAPIILGKGMEGIGDLGIRSLKEAVRPRRVRTRMIGDDMVWDLEL